MMQRRTTMPKTESSIRSIFGAIPFFALGFGLVVWGVGSFRTAEATSVVSISGIVKDGTGNGLRGARIIATSGYRSVSRFTDRVGRYKIGDLPAGSYEIAATGWGLDRKSVNKEL